MMTFADKLAHLQDNHMAEWLKMRSEVFDWLSSKQSMFCVCRRLATGFHESGCRQFQKKVNVETVKRLEHLMPKCEWVPCDQPAKYTESSGDGRLVRVCTPHRRLLNKQKLANANV